MVTVRVVCTRREEGSKAEAEDKRWLRAHIGLLRSFVCVHVSSGQLFSNHAKSCSLVPGFSLPFASSWVASAAWKPAESKASARGISAYNISSRYWAKIEIQNYDETCMWPSVTSSALLP